MLPESGEQLEALLDHVRRGEPVDHYDAVRVRKDGTRIDVSLSLAPVRDPAGVVIGASAIARDVTRRKRAEQEVRLLNAELEQRVLTRTAQRDVAERSAHAGSFRWVIGSSESTWSPEFDALFDVEPGEFDGDLDGAFAARIHPDDLGELRRSLADVEPLGVLPPHDFRIVRRDGDERIMRAGGTVERDAAGKATVLVGYVEDVSERLRAEAALRASEARYRGLVEGMLEGLAYCRVVFDDEGRAIDLVTLAVNQAFARVTGLPDAVGKPISEVLPHAAEQIPEFFAALGRVSQGGTPEEFDVDFVPLAQVQHVSAFSPAPEHVVAIFTDVTERRRSEEMNARLAAIVGSSDDAIFSKTLAGTILTWNAGAERMYGYAADEIIGQSVSRLMPPGSEGELAALLARVGRGNVVRRHDGARLRRDGSALRVSLSVSPLVDRAGVIVGASVIEHDVTEQLRAEETLAESARRHRAILQTTMDGFWLGDAQGRLIEVNEAYCRMSGFSSEELVGMHISDLESAETAEKMKSHMETLIATGEDRFETRHRRKDGSVYDIAISVQYRPGDGGQFVAFLQDISERKAAEVELAQSALELRERLFDTVKAMGALVGVRDPYTATHEQRVTELAAAFAVEMGLDEGRREGLVLASQIHDIGKVAVPAEILSKPGALSAFEFALVRQHSEIGREILATINFRQPVATIVAQHHERLDGSGYPDGLKGDETMLEARILAVADVVEAMASHRPYRAALPLEEALAEIEAGAGTRYDADTCAAALRLFRERRFTFAA
jgi:PAS domain S-box-containing protein